MKTSNNGVELIKKHEGVRTSAYLCPAGVWTIGYGHTGKEVRAGCTVTLEQAEEQLRADLSLFEDVVSKYVESTLTQNQFDALVSLVYNIGAGAFIGSTLFRLVNSSPNHPEIEIEFSKWVNARGRRLSGLVKRRAEEAKLYFSHLDN